MNLLNCDDVRNFVADNRDDGTQLWVLHHLPRTGGTSLSTELAWRLQPNYNVHIPRDAFSDEHWDSETALELSFRHFWESQQTTSFRFVSGHLLRSQVERLRQLPRARMFTILREPCQHLASLYSYHRSPASPGHRAFIRRYPHFDSFIEEPFFQNSIARFIGGEGATAEQCQDILLRDYVFCGVFEQLPASLRLIGALLGFEISDQVLHLNSSPPGERDVVGDIGPYRDKILALNAVDAEIYRFVWQRFHERTAHVAGYLETDDAQGVTHRLARQHAIAERNVRRLLAEIDRRERRLASADNDIRRLTAAIEERDARIAAADDGLRRLTGEVEGRDRRLAAADKDLRHLMGEIEERDRRLVAAEEELRRLNGELEARDARLVAADKDMRHLIGQVEDRDRRLLAADQHLRRLIERDAELEAIKRSSTWRLTAPLRGLGRNWPWLVRPVREAFVPLKVFTRRPVN